jgi:hypothetical protein
MKQRIQPLLPVSPADGQTIPGQARPAIRQSAFWWLHEHSRVGLLAVNPRPAGPGTHQFAALFHAMRLTSGNLSLQSP